MSIQSSSVLVKLTVRQWDGFKKDKRVTERVDEEYNTAGGAGNYNKRLLSKAVLEPIQHTISRIRAEHARLTMPWCYDGVSLLPNKLISPYTHTMRALEDTLGSHVSYLKSQYPIHITNQAARLGNMFRMEDYPDADELEKRYGVTFNFFPVPHESHFALDIEKEEEQRIKTALTQQLKDTQSQVLSSLYERVKDIVEKVHERLSDPENIFRDSLVDNVAQLVGVLPDLNIFDDPVLKEVQMKMSNELLITNAQRLRDDPEVRKQVANSAFDILGLLKGEHGAT
jgi:hypothetical protein